MRYETKCAILFFFFGGFFWVWLIGYLWLGVHLNTTYKQNMVEKGDKW